MGGVRPEHRHRRGAEPGGGTRGEPFVVGRGTSLEGWVGLGWARLGLACLPLGASAVLWPGSVAVSRLG